MNLEKLITLLPVKEISLTSFSRSIGMTVENFCKLLLNLRSEDMVKFDSSIQILPADLYSKEKIFMYGRPWRAIKKR